jgi:hypothetical protein
MAEAHSKEKLLASCLGSKRERKSSGSHNHLREHNLKASQQDLPLKVFTTPQQCQAGDRFSGIWALKDMQDSTHRNHISTTFLISQSDSGFSFSVFQMQISLKNKTSLHTETR